MSLGSEDCGLKEGGNEWLAPAEIHVCREGGSLHSEYKAYFRDYKTS
jgi:hypothetical protein